MLRTCQYQWVKLTCIAWFSAQYPKSPAENRRDGQGRGACGAGQHPLEAARAAPRRPGLRAWCQPPARPLPRDSVHSIGSRSILCFGKLNDAADTLTAMYSAQAPVRKMGERQKVRERFFLPVVTRLDLSLVAKKYQPFL